MLAIRLKPIGRKHQISFRIVVAEKRSKLNGKYREDLGFYNPATNKFTINNERAKYWLSVGAQPSDTVYNIFVSAKVIEGPKRPVKIKKPEIKETETKEAPANLSKEEKVNESVTEAQEAQENISSDSTDEIKNNSTDSTDSTNSTEN
ncbi:MAG TPA: 30S ribosomal protein S16 [Candidatus Paceibacterota bacterium]|nr:30S ribosomal protein S16 [Candidatus Paceibacterota bacterium]